MRGLEVLNMCFGDHIFNGCIIHLQPTSSQLQHDQTHNPLSIILQASI